MNECSRTRLLLPIEAAVESPDGGLARAKAHLADCARCREEETQIVELIRVLRGSTRANHQLPDAVRGRIALEAAGRVGARPWFLGLRASLFSPLQRSGFAAAAALLLVALTTLYVIPRDGGSPVRRGGVESIQVVADGVTVRLAWHNGDKGTYTVYKSADPRAISAGEAHVVRGHAWTDTDPEVSQVVFYSVE